MADPYLLVMVVEGGGGGGGGRLARTLDLPHFVKRNMLVRGPLP